MSVNADETTVYIVTAIAGGNLNGSVFSLDDFTTSYDIVICFQCYTCWEIIYARQRLQRGKDIRLSILFETKGLNKL